MRLKHSGASCINSVVDRFLSYQNQQDKSTREDRVDKSSERIDIEGILSKRTFQEFKKLEQEATVEAVLTGVLLERLNSSIDFSDFHLRSFKSSSGQSLLAGVLSELDRNAQNMLAENPNLNSLLTEWINLEKELVHSASEPQKAEELIKRLNEVLKRGGKDFLAYLLNRELVAQVSNVLAEYIRKMVDLVEQNKEPPEHSLDEVIFGEINRKAKLAKALLLGEKPTEELQKSKIDELVEKAKPSNQTPQNKTTFF